jgi:peroxiredoxin Q/BCP
MPDAHPMPAVGEPAPPIDEPDTQGGRFSLAERAGKWVVVYFYPRANTPG